MCEIDTGDRCEVWDERHRKARKEHKCSCCYRTIMMGELYLVHFSVYEGNCETQKCCAECEFDRHQFSQAHEGWLPQPHYLPEMLDECISEDPDSEEKWKPMLERILASRKTTKEANDGTVPA